PSPALRPPIGGGAAAPLRDALRPLYSPTLSTRGDTPMRGMMRTALAFGLVALAAGTASAQGGRGFGGMMGGGGLGQLLANPGVQKELKLTDDQVGKAEKIAEAQREKMRERFQSAGGGQGGDPAAARARMQAMMKEANAEVKKEADAFLKPEQMKRLE